MCGAGAIGVGLTAFSSILGAKSAEMQAQAASENYEYEASVHDRNVEMHLNQALIFDKRAEDLAGDASDKKREGGVAVRRIKRAGRRFIQGQRAQIGASGIEVNTGAGREIQEKSTQQIALDAVTTDYNFAKEVDSINRDKYDQEVKAWQARVSATDESRAAKYAREASELAKKGGFYGSGASLAAGGAKVASWYAE